MRKPSLLRKAAASCGDLHQVTRDRLMGVSSLSAMSSNSSLVVLSKSSRPLTISTLFHSRNPYTFLTSGAASLRKWSNSGA
jgi:hypothetical protein